MPSSHSRPPANARQQEVTIANDKTALNILLDRRPDQPLEVDRKFDLTSFETTLDQAIDRAISSRQEILEAALTNKTRTPRSPSPSSNTRPITPSALVWTTG